MQVPGLRLLSRLIVLVVPFLLIGCTTSQYISSPRYVPLNERKGDTNVNFSLLGVQLGYAFSNKFSAFATGFTYSGANGSPEGIPIISPLLDEKPEDRTCSSKEINLGLTYFGAKERFHYEFLVGGGMGNMAYRFIYHIERYSPDKSLNMQADKWNVYIQPNFSWNLHERVDSHLSIALFAKFNSVNYYNTTVTDDVLDGRSDRWQEGQGIGVKPYPKYDDHLLYFSNHEKSNFFFIEPGISAKAGRKHFQGTIQLSYIAEGGGPSLYYKPYSISIGFALNFNVFDLKAAVQKKKK